MREIKKEEMMIVDGGANPIFVTSIVGVIITFVVGLFHGYANPKSCND